VKHNQDINRILPTFRPIAMIVVALALFLGLGASSQADSEEGLTTGSQSNSRVFTVDVAEDFDKFVPSPPFDQDGVPQRGSFFITEGKIYPKGTIKDEGTSFDPNAEGAIGQWFCRGTHLVSGVAFPEARFAVDTAQAYLLSDDNNMIVTDGLEGGFGHILQRVVSGGTGKYRNFIGIQKQELLGFNKSGGVNLRVTFELKRVRF
jgi:hypothetical protein